MLWFVLLRFASSGKVKNGSPSVYHTRCDRIQYYAANCCMSILRVSLDRQKSRSSSHAKQKLAVGLVISGFLVLSVTFIVLYVINLPTNPVVLDNQLDPLNPTVSADPAVPTDPTVPEEPSSAHECKTPGCFRAGKLCLFFSHTLIRTLPQ